MENLLIMHTYHARINLIKFYSVVSLGFNLGNYWVFIFFIFGKSKNE